MKSGIVLIDKPAGVSSAGVVAQIKRKLSGIKTGHAGTLDPAATGLLVCLTGQSTRIAHYLEAGEKIYSGEFEFGVTTATDDLDGEVISRTTPSFSPEQLAEALQRFRGLIQQVPPQISAVKIDGERAYRRARAGEVVNISAREVTVSDCSLTPVTETRYRYLVRCSKGTYIRSLARDLGELLGCGAAVATLRREGSSPFSVNQAVPLSEFQEADVRSWDAAFPNAPRRFLEPHELQALRQGIPSARAALIGERSLATGPVIIECDEFGAVGLLAQDGTGEPRVVWIMKEQGDANDE